MVIIALGQGRGGRRVCVCVGGYVGAECVKLASVECGGWQFIKEMWVFAFKILSNFCPKTILLSH